MKKMSEVFDFSQQIGYPVSWSDDQVRAGNKAIISVDALADALDAIIEMAWLISEDLADEFAARPEVIAASKAIAAYRGEK